MKKLLSLNRNPWHASWSESVVSLAVSVSHIITSAWNALKQIFFRIIREGEYLQSSSDGEPQRRKYIDQDPTLDAP